MRAITIFSITDQDIKVEVIKNSLEYLVFNFLDMGYGS